MTIYSMRRNFIASLTQEDGTIVTDHDQKVGLLWLAYRDRLGVSEFTGLVYELSELIQEVDLPTLDDPFSMDKILAILKDLPSDHSPDPDGFNAALFNSVGPSLRMTLSDYVVILLLDL
jgi:hypothetical protein